MHRLLSSDRAKSASAEVLNKNILKYISCCKNANSISLNEMSAMLKQILKYNINSFSHEKVHENYFKYIEQFNIHLSDEEKKKIIIADESLFKEICQINNSSLKEYVNLVKVVVARENYIKHLGFSRYSKYPLSFLAMKLKTSGLSVYEQVVEMFGM